jgi:hypothetical protein
MSSMHAPHPVLAAYMTARHPNVVSEEICEQHAWINGPRLNQQKPGVRNAVRGGCSRLRRHDPLGQLRRILRGNPIIN